MDRRNFLRTGSIALLGSLTAGSALGAPSAVKGSLESGAGGKFALSSAMTHFGVSEEDLRKVLAAALGKGGDYADLFFEHTFTNAISLQDGEVNRCNSYIDFGMGVRVLAGDQSGYAYVENVTLDEMLKVARTAARIASSKQGSYPVRLVEKPLKKNYYAITSSWEEVTIKEKMPYLQKLNDKMFSLDKRVHKVNASLNDVTSHILFCNSEGVMYYDYRPMVTLSAMCIMEQNGQIENSYSSRSYRKGFEFLTDEVVDVIAREAVDKTAILFQAIKPKGGEMPVVMGAGGSGILLHEAIGHAFEADFNRKNTSIFSDQLNKKICNEHISVIDDGTIPFNRGAVNFDDEGVEGQKTYLVTNGVLTSYLHDRISAKHYGIAPTGNGRRESFRNPPIPRMRATYMEPGNMKEEDIIASVKKGIFVDQFTNGQVQIGAGDFTFFVKSGYLIEDGKLTQPIKDVNIIGNGPKALADITMVAGNDKIDNGSWTCGKDGQSCPVTCGMPSALVSKLTVGGES
ncbi:TldD/PmbA family protein [Bacteroides sp.]|uniref:TldD/PmbA family protein n=1 Tax=Bacteroides sp. TaxID=29523 RepID=UPI001B5EB3DE|nr:TldD/PmbA family protein [Bacteroides sp.]MBP6065282.1 TldD/PmbA family protein [Bacteroides sp.]MBP6066569.1 TldD/PmbA family protein [Bacteroides sp.]MBP6935711.1 TldD/PmbA family protein [Bacteroides sp.]MBP8622416.1 TldD/PmbA family protein [Bacteroides sp.]MBP9507969.1 TldD/PmbA family protein [Bacteroides sp.]